MSGTRLEIDPEAGARASNGNGYILQSSCSFKKKVDEAGVGTGMVAGASRLT